MNDLKKKFRFRDFKVYNDVRKFSLDLKILSKKKFPSGEKFCLLQQLWRALDSIILNIAEGTERGTDKDFAHFLNNSHTSINEVVACLDIAFDNEYLTQAECESFIDQAAKLADQLTAFRKKLLNSPTK